MTGLINKKKLNVRRKILLTAEEMNSRTWVIPARCSGELHNPPVTTFINEYARYAI
jgi:hypothetical protein